MANRPMPDAETVRNLIDYNPETGELTWKQRERDWFTNERQFKTWNKRYAGKPALNSNTNEGYLAGSILYKPVLAHRAIWAILHGEWPEFVDHINHNRRDNRACNLRAATREINAKNRALSCTNKSGRIGVSAHPSGRWTAHWPKNGRGVSRQFKTFEEAVAAREQFEAENDYHPNHGKETVPA